MEKIKKYWPYQVVILLFVVVSYMFTPQVFRNEVVNQSDIASWRGMANEIITYNQSNPDGDKALWTNSMFSGMPATTISVIYDGDYTDYVYRAIHKLAGVRPPSYLLISLVGGFLLFLAFGVNVWLSAIGAFAITFCSYNLQIIQVGHNSKMVAIAFMPWVLAALVYAYRKKPLLGSLLFGFSLSFQIEANHPQITYYLAIMVVGYAGFCMYKMLMEGMAKKFMITSAMLLVAGSLGIATNVNHLWPTYEYSKFTMRGGSELATEEGKEQKGLDLSYATSWSYSPGEMPNLMIPNFNGGSSGGELTTKSETYKALRSGGYQGAGQIIKQMPLYWGPQPFTAGPMYIGAVAIFLFVLGLALLKGPLKWWVVTVSVLAVLLSWGSNFMIVTEFFYKYVPLYSKFRTVSMILVVLQITIPLVAILVLQKLMEKDEVIPVKKITKGIYIALAVTAGFSLLFALVPSLAGSFVSQADAQMPDLLRKTLVQDRISLLRADAFRSLFFIVSAAAALWLFVAGKLKKAPLIAVIAILVFADLWFVGRRYLNDNHFVKEREFNNQYALRPVDKMILEDRDPNYRVLDLSINTFNDSHVSYHHKTIGGYSPAKLQTYQDLIDRHISKEMQQFASDIGSSTTVEQAQKSLGNYPVLNMLNTRYIVIGAENPPLVNSKAFGNAWYVNDFFEAGSLAQEINALGTIPDLQSTAVLNKDFFEKIKGASTDSLSKDELIVLTSYSPNRLEYEYNSLHERVVVFSEIYYPAGWRATIDGRPVEIIRANYVLRALKVPAGNHRIEFEFRPESVYKGEYYSAIASGILIVLLFLALAAELFKPKMFYKKD